MRTEERERSKKVGRCHGAVIASGSEANQTKAAAAQPGLRRRCAPSQ
jgi:hypothetical protein